MVDLERQLRDAARKSGLSMLAMSQRADIPYAAVHSFIARERGHDLGNGEQAGDAAGLGAAPERAKAEGGQAMKRKAQRHATVGKHFQTQRLRALVYTLVRLSRAAAGAIDPHD
jgi:hypothetical protein